jgi:2-haloacid dehalogenase
MRLSPYPEVQQVLEQMQHKQIAVFSNSSYDMLDPLLKNASFESLFDHIMDEVKQYKQPLRHIIMY